MAKSKRKDKGEVELLKLQLARALADYDNLKRRTERDLVQIENTTRTEVFRRIMPTLDMFYEAQKHLADSGLELALTTFEKVLDSEGIEKINPKVGGALDENLHEVVDTIQGSKLKPGSIEKTLVPGYKFENGEVIRHAKVRVVII